MRKRPILLLALVTTLFQGQSTKAALVTIGTRSGRSFTAELDERTSGACLWLRWNKAGAVLLRPILWTQVREVVVDGETYTPGELRTVLAKAERAVNDPFTDDAESVPRPAAMLRNGSAPRVPTHEPRIPVRSLRVDAYAANWDPYVPSDGVVVHILPLDAWGSAVPAAGTLELELIGQARSVPRGSYGAVLLGSATVVLDPEQFGPAGYICRIPFQNTSPEFNAGLRSFGLVHARLSVPGDGVFEATAATVRVRPYSALRDRFEQLRGTRFLPNEATGSIPGATWRP